ncbi:baculoviral IAP repeat-containing protein 5.2-A [Anabrus simplex]|uniref:baculoviral IAP repeat-containing protein 5.2-A n=1 Tax=Anabrus simplex TaxID=316456 RepID=UPI0035A2BD2F
MPGINKQEDLTTRLYKFEQRLKTFHSWPFGRDCACTAEKMAEAGFYVLNPKREPDLVKCFFCLKELDGWEEADDPWKEHESHSQECSFIKLGKEESEMTLGEILQLLVDRTLLISKRQYEAARQQFTEGYENVKELLNKI